MVDNALRRLSLASVLSLTALSIVRVVPIYNQALVADLAVFRKMDWGAKAVVFAIAVTSNAGMVFLYMSIGGKNAILASLILISYPVLVVLFAYLLFRKCHLNLGVNAGALLVFAGVGLTIWRSP